MAKIEQCLIDIDLANSLHHLVQALGLKTPGGALGFRCPGCEQPVRPHGGDHPHFEHVERNPKCDLSHKLPPPKEAPPAGAVVLEDDGADGPRPTGPTT